MDESEIHLENWLAVETMRADGDMEDRVDKRDPRTVMSELPEEGAFLCNKEEAKKTSNEKDSDKLDCCDWIETKTPLFKPNPWEILPKILESEAHRKAEKEVLADTSPSLALTEIATFVNEVPYTLRENEAEVAPFEITKLDSTGTL
jgi:hypothetical protein